MKTKRTLNYNNNMKKRKSNLQLHLPLVRRNLLTKIRNRMKRSRKLLLMKRTRKKNRRRRNLKDKQNKKNRRKGMRKLGFLNSKRELEFMKNLESYPRSFLPISKLSMDSSQIRIHSLSIMLIVIINSSKPSLRTSLFSLLPQIQYQLINSKISLINSITCSILKMNSYPLASPDQLKPNESSNSVRPKKNLA